MVKKERVTDTRARRYIRITDVGLWKRIDELSQTEKYGKSFNLIINDALFYGLPLLHEKVFGDVKDEASAEGTERDGTAFEGEADDAFCQAVVSLLKEIVLNETINKSMLSSIFNACKEGYNGEAVSGREFAAGGYAGTPDYLEDYELKGLKALGRRRK